MACCTPDRDTTAATGITWEGLLPVGDGHQLWVTDYGRADGLPVVFLHGGPGSGCSPAQRQLFDPQRYRVIFIDQRGAGRSQPLGSLQDNTTAHLVADIEQVRERLGIARWLVFGGSWGSLLALCYARRHPQRVSGLVLRGLFLGTTAEVTSYLQRASARARAYPDWPAGIPHPDQVVASHTLAGWADAVFADNPDQALTAIQAWLNLERLMMDEPPSAEPPTAAQQAKVRIQLHYLPAQAFVCADELLASLSILHAVPTALVQGLDDPVCPPAIARRVHAHWPQARWHGVAGAGHAALAPVLAAALQAALSDIADYVDAATGATLKRSDSFGPR